MQKIRIVYSEGQEVRLEFKWGTSRGRDSYGYTTCSLYADGIRVAACNGGGYDMRGTCLGHFLAGAFADRLRQRISAEPVKCERCDGRGGWETSQGPATCSRCNGSGKAPRELYGLTFHDPDYDPGKAIVGKDVSDRTLGGAPGMTVEEAEKAGLTVGLERYQAFYRASSPAPDEKHRVPLIDGACGMSSVEAIGRAIGLSLKFVTQNSRHDVYILHVGA